jgi:hypothetical protein
MYGRAGGRTDGLGGRTDSQVNGPVDGPDGRADSDGRPAWQDKEHMRRLLTCTACRKEVAVVCDAAYSTGGVYCRAQ